MKRLLAIKENIDLKVNISLLVNNKQMLTYFEWTWSNVDLLGNDDL